MPRKQFVNNATNSSVASITSGATSITVNDGSVFPATGDYHLILDSISTYEIIKCTSRATDVLTVVRAQEGTTAVAHPPGTKVILTITPESYRRFIADEVETAHHDNLMNRGLMDINNSPLPLSSWTWLNQGGATATEYDDGSITINAPGNVSAHNNRILHKPIPTIPYTIRATIIPQLHNGNDADPLAVVGIGLRDSASGRLWQNSIVMLEGALSRDRMLIRDYSATTTFSSDLTDFDSPVGREFHCFEIFHAVDNNITFRSSYNGFAWREFIHDGSIHNFDQLFFFAMPGDHATSANNFHTICTLVGWSER